MPAFFLANQVVRRPSLTVAGGRVAIIPRILLVTQLAKVHQRPRLTVHLKNDCSDVLTTRRIPVTLYLTI